MADDIKSKMEKVIDEIIKTEEVSKAMPTSLPANGGKDEIKSGTPLMEEKELEAKKKADEAKKAQDDDKDADDKKKKEDEEKAKMKKAQDDKDADDKKKKEDEEKAKKSSMKKSIEELASVLDEEELELIKAWREDAAASTEITKTTTAAEDKGETLAKSLAKAVADQIEPLTKAMKEKDDLIKGMQEKIEKLASQPAYDRRSISTLETLEKSGANTQEISKSQVLDKMLELQVAGKGVTSHHISEFEATKNISDPVIRNLVFKELKIN